VSALLQPSSRLLVAAPLRLEASALRRGASGMRVLRTGAGPARARRAAEELRRDAAAALLVAGVCGALDPALEPGDVLVASELRDPSGPVHALDHDALYEALASLGLRVRVGAIVGSDHLVRGAERAHLFETGARAVDMESPWLAAGAGERPFGVVRVVVDGPEYELLRPAALGRGLLALRTLSALAPGLQRWAAQVAPDAPVSAPAPSVWHAAL
jgi:4-hydroxy-3-methylbut-2-enyl diphosphate reductase